MPSQGRRQIFLADLGYLGGGGCFLAEGFCLPGAGACIRFLDDGCGFPIEDLCFGLEPVVELQQEVKKPARSLGAKGRLSR